MKSVITSGASGFWRDASHATAQLLANERQDYLVYDHLAEITRSLMALARSKEPEAGFARRLVLQRCGQPVKSTELRC